MLGNFTVLENALYRAATLITVRVSVFRAFVWLESINK
jgi:hypothetical protein